MIREEAIKELRTRYLTIYKDTNIKILVYKRGI